MPIWGRQSAGGGGERTNVRYTGQDYGRGVPSTRRRRDLASSRAREQEAALRSSSWGAQENPYNQAMAAARAQADAEAYLTNNRFRTMMGIKNTMDSMRSGRPNYGTNLPFQNIPAAAAMTGLNLPQSGFQTYADLAAAGRLGDETTKAVVSDPNYGGMRETASARGR
jgi:hypothetical protein